MFITATLASHSAKKIFERVLLQMVCQIEREAEIFGEVFPLQKDSLSGGKLATDLCEAVGGSQIFSVWSWKKCA